MWPSFERVGWFLLRSTPGWRTSGIRTAVGLAWAAAAAAAFFALVAALTLTFAFAFAGFLSLILAIVHSLLARLGWGVARRRSRSGPPLLRRLSADRGNRW